jgi:hypothetical protein
MSLNAARAADIHHGFLSAFLFLDHNNGPLAR